MGCGDVSLHRQNTMSRGWPPFGIGNVLSKSIVRPIEEAMISNKDSRDEMFDGKGDRIRIPEKRETEINKVV